MGISVPGVGDVPVVWHPASDEDFKDKAEGARSGYQPIAIVHHRIVGSLSSADLTFAHSDADPATVGSPGRPVSAQFAVGHKAGKLQAIQYVDLSDTAYCNGDCSQTAYGSAFPSRWDTWYGHKGHNERTVSIEHEDNAGLPAGDPLRGVVPEDVIKLSIALDRLLLSGNLTAIRAAGIRCRDAATATALGKIVPGSRTLLDHNDIAGKGKPYCWRPWLLDKGFPRARYITELSAPAPTPPQEADVPQLTEYLPGQSATILSGVNVRSTPKILTDNSNRLRVTSGTEAWVATGWVKGDVDPSDGSDQWLTRWAGGRWEYTAHSNVSAGPADLTPYSKGDVTKAHDTGYAEAKAKASSAVQGI